MLFSETGHSPGEYTCMEGQLYRYNELLKNLTNKTTFLIDERTKMWLQFWLNLFCYCSPMVIK